MRAARKALARADRGDLYVFMCAAIGWVILTFKGW